MAESPASKKVVILDCCHADAGLVDVALLQQHIATEGVAAIAAAVRGPAISPAGEELACFTKHLVEILRGGSVANASGEVTVLDVFDELSRRFPSEEMRLACAPAVAFQQSGNGHRTILACESEPPCLDLVAKAINVRPEHIPARLKKQVPVLGLFRAKELACELMSVLKRGAARDLELAR